MRAAGENGASALCFDRRQRGPASEGERCKISKIGFLCQSMSDEVCERWGGGSCGLAGRSTALKGKLLF